MRYLFLLLLAGCSHASIDASSDTLSGTSGGAQARVHLEGRSLAAVVIAGMFIAAAAEEAREPRPFPSFAAFADWFRPSPKAELDPSRTVSEQDCTRPIDITLGNLRCR